MTKRFDLKFWLGIGISIFFLAFLFRKIDFNLLLATLRSADYRYILAAVIFTFISYFMRAIRWHYLLISVKRIPLASLYPATIIGYMANNLLPARLGEFVRAYVLAKKEGLQTPVVFASLVIDRLCDGFTVMLMLLLTLFTLQLPHSMAEADSLLRSGGTITFLLYVGLVVFLIFLKRQTIVTLRLVAYLLRPLPRTLSDRLIPLLGSFIEGIRIPSRGVHVVAVLFSSILIWTFALIPIDLILQAFGIHLPIAASMFIMVLLVFAVLVPASPGYIGTYHYACFKGLSAFQIPETTSISIALVIHGTSFFPVIVAGFYHLWREKMSLHTVRRAGDSV